MGKRSYGQHCTVARALDIVGERWTLLLVRELLTGPKRFKDLLAGLTGIGTNLLAARLKALEEHGVVRRGTLPPPAGSGVYELTELGRSLEPVVLTLSRWGSRLVEEEPREGDDVRPAWAAMALRSLFEPEAGGPRETYEFRIDGEAFHLRVEGGAVEARQGAADAPGVVVSGGAGVFLALTAGRLAPEEALESGKVRIEGDQEGAVVARCLRMLGSATV
ncbi:MAG: transcriptional regulator [Rubrobacter sp.]|nr:transcriptional regulator [Rubrobacter sp.]MBA3952134.1 transcriptional regulator [Rubrobacter sp.]MDQ3362417.1 winged helix-turn-helix transcriptional regulator [Actinomycetota bacterium]MDQ3376432.1 winged helix-turn-helix transcriptional regulator [Actinomycetota bacterium]